MSKRKFKAKEVQEIRIIDSRQENGKFASRLYIKVRGSWFTDPSDIREVRFEGDYGDRKALIDEFLFLQDSFKPCDEPGGFTR